MKGDYTMEFTVEQQEMIASALESSVKKIEENMVYAGDQFLTVTSEDNRYGIRGNVDCWTQSFWTGMVWLAYEKTGNEAFKTLGQKHSESFDTRLTKRLGTDTHDLGFMYTLSCVADYKLTGSESAKKTAIEAADQLMIRYKEKGEFIQAWGSITDPNMYRMIIDCYMNLPLLFWAYEVTGEESYKDVAIKHANTGRKYLLRDDDSSFHTFYFNPETGEPERGVTAQGYADDSCWSRGQAWGVYGFALAYHYTKDPGLMDDFIRVTDYFMAHLPEDQVAYWDLYFTDGDEERDTSAASIAACGIYEMLQFIEDKTLYNKYKQLADDMMASLIKSYSTFDTPTANGLLFEGVYSKPGNRGVDEMTIWGDYYFMEALIRMDMDWKMYW